MKNNKLLVLLGASIWCSVGFGDEVLQVDMGLQLSTNEFISAAWSLGAKNDEIVDLVRKRSLWLSISESIAAASFEKRLFRSEAYLKIAQSVDPVLFEECVKIHAKSWVEHGDYRRLARVIYFRQATEGAVSLMSSEELMRLLEGKSFAELEAEEDGQYAAVFIREVARLEKADVSKEMLELLRKLKVRWESVSEDPYKIAKSLGDIIMRCEEK